MINEYNWSSYKEYVYKENVADIDFVLNLFNSNKKDAVDEFIKFNSMIENKFSDAEFEMENTMNDEETIECIKRILGVDVNSIRNYNTKLRDEYIVKILNIKGISAKQISKLLNISETSIYKIISRHKT